MITAQGGITKWQRVKISSDGGMDAGKPAIAKGANYPEKSSMDTAMEKHIVRPKRESRKVQSGVSKRKSLANIQDSKSVFRLLYGVASRKEKQGERINVYQVQHGS